jgi:predicted anti-sigma-YlaC factor YlaD
MDTHVTDWLGAYYDGELAGRRKQQVEDHLRGCRECQAQLEELHKLSALLREAPQAVTQLSAQRFQTQVKLRMGAALSRPAWQRALKAGWQLAPLGAVAAWAFGQTALAITAAVLRIGTPGGLSLSGQIFDLPLGLIWLNQAISVFGFVWNPAEIGLGLLNLGLTALLAVFLYGWLASYAITAGWITHRQAEKQYDLLRV